MTTDPTNGTAVEPLFSTLADDEDMMELVAFFVDELKHRVQSLESAFANGNADELKTLSHQLKGAAGGYGFPAITAVAAELEDELKKGERSIGDLKSQVDALVNICRRAKA